MVKCINLLQIINSKQLPNYMFYDQFVSHEQTFVFLKDATLDSNLANTATKNNHELLTKKSHACLNHYIIIANRSVQNEYGSNNTCT